MTKRRGIFRTKHKIGKTWLYAKRDSKGRFVDIQRVPRAMRLDMARKAKTKVKPGYGFRGDTIRSNKKKK
jgi:hypothetical protein